ncbi:MAG: NUDIX domain-containing protein [Proteobacteria bacterium]|nr:NUDIX domain-containing protein [Pseudomonadota bacterium]
MFPANHKHTAGGVDNDAIDGEKRRFRRRHDYSIYVESGDVKTPESAGLLLYRRRQDLEVLLAHPGGPYWQKKDDGAWTVPKGEIRDGDDPYATALREFEEETGLRPHGKTLSLGSLRQSGGKLVHAWAIENDWDPAQLVSNQFTIEWPPRSGRTATFPEIDRANWFALSTARRKILKSQIDFLNRLEAALDSAAR